MTRTCFAIVLSLCSSIVVHAQQHGLINNSKTPFMPLKTVDLDDVRWKDGFWGDKQAQCAEVMIPHLGRLMEDPDIIHAFENFLVAAGIKEGVFKGWSFHDGDFYKYVEAMAYAYGLTNDERINDRMDEIIEVIGKAQRDDGYLHTMIQIGHGIQGIHHSSEREFKLSNGPFSVDGQHEFYNFGHLMTAACIHHRITGKTNFLDIAVKSADLLYSRFKDPSPELAAIDWNPPHLMGLVEMYRTTGDKKYLELADTFITMRGTGTKRKNTNTGLDHSQKRTPIRQETEARGHAGHGNYLYCGVADVYSETGDASLLNALERIWKNVTTRKMYVTGATGANHYGVSKHHDMVREAYGDDFELPNISSYNETCANIGNAMWNWRMFLITGEARFADIVELVYYNSALSGIQLDGKHYFYTNPLRCIHGHPQSSKDAGQRNKFMSVFCCPPNIIRTIASMHAYAYCTSDEGIWVNVYGSNALDTELADGSSVKLVQESDYPWDGNVSLKVDIPESKTFSMMLRVPAWANQATLQVNGTSVEETLKPGSYFNLNRTWSAGDAVELDLPMPAQLIVPSPNVEETRNQVAIKRGPLVYCLESVDLPDGANLNDVVIPQNIQLTARFDEQMLSGITVLEGEAEALQNTQAEDKLYRPLTPQSLQKIKIKLIPYYAWANRGRADMSVWLPLRY